MSSIVSFGPVRKDPGSVHVTTESRTIILSECEAALADRRGFALATLNLDHIVKLRQDQTFLHAYLAQSFVVADGNPIVWLSRMAGRSVELVPGSELVDPLAGLAARLGVSVVLLGSTESALRAAGEGLLARYPDLKIAAYIAPPFGFDPTGEAADTILDEVDQSGAGLCFLALGAPKQEVLAARGLERAKSTGFVSIGAGLDFIAGTQTRAPVWVRRIKMEWAWRMFGNPKRLFMRYAACFAILPGLALSALRERS